MQLRIRAGLDPRSTHPAAGIGACTRRDAIACLSITASVALQKSDRGSNRLLDQLREGDVVVVTKLDRLGRSLPQIFDIVETIEQRGAGLRSLAESDIDTTTAAGKLVFRVFAVVAEFERDRLRERTLEGIARARAAGTHLGRPKTLDTHQITNLRRLRKQGESYGSLAKTFKIARSTAREYCKDIVSIEH